MKVTIREYREEDFDRLVELEIEIVHMMSEIDPHKRFRSREDFDGKRFSQCTLQKIQKAEGKMYVADFDNQIIGYIVGTVEEYSDMYLLNHYPGKQGYIDALYVQEEHQGKGIAPKLMEAIENHFRSIGCDLSSVACVAANDKAHDFYIKMGYGEQYIDFLKKL